MREKGLLPPRFPSLIPFYLDKARVLTQKTLHNFKAINLQSGSTNLVIKS